MLDLVETVPRLLSAHAHGHCHIDALAQRHLRREHAADEWAKELSHSLFSLWK